MRFVPSRWRCAIFALIVACAASSHAQDGIKAKTSPDSFWNRPKREITIWGGVPVGYPHLLADVVRDVRQERLYLMGVDIDQRLWADRKLDFRGNLGVVPVAILSQPAGSGRSHTYGGGLSGGIELSPKVSWRLQPYVSGGIGCLIFTRDAPVPNSGRFNLAARMGAGFRIPTKGRQGLKVGMWLHHFSDAATRPRNPGVDSIILYVGYAFPGLHAGR